MARQLSRAEIKKKIDSSHQRIDNWQEFHGVLETMRDTSWIFRGVSSPLHYPIPSIGREKVFGPYKRAQEERLFREFKDRAVSIISGLNFGDWDWLAYAQHIGVPTPTLRLDSESPSRRFFCS